MNVKLILSYDGAAYFGWQKTRTGPSIQETLETALYKVLRKTVSTEACSRTDRGVHAQGQVAHFFLEEETDLARLHYRLNSVLPHDIRVLAMDRTHDAFHPTLDAKGKEYRYQICQGPVQDPLHRHFSWHVHQPLNLEAMFKAAKVFIGTHDFASFTTEKIDDSTRTLFDVRIIPLLDNRLEIHLVGNRFLYKMARRIVGTLVSVGKRSLSPDTILSLFTNPNRAQAGMTAPAHGLYLHQVFYTSDIPSEKVEYPSEKVTV